MLSSAIAVLLLSACVISTQDGERRHLNSPHPDEIAFHFDTPFNKVVLFGRSALLLVLPAWVIVARRKGSDILGPAFLALATMVAAGWWLWNGWPRVFEYRIEVLPEVLRIQVPSEPELEIPWEQIQAIDIEGVAYDVGLGVRGTHSIRWAPEWEDLTIERASGARHDLDLRPLSVEQRGTLWRAISRKAQLGEKMETITPPGGRSDP
jgi:hypothetical protein